MQNTEQSNIMLTAPEQIKADYDRDGVVRVRAFFSPEDVAGIRRELDRYQRDIAPQLSTTEVTFERDGKCVRNLWHMEQHDQYFAELPCRPEIQKLIERLVNGTPVLTGVETFNKPARVGSGVPPHQDNAYFCQTPPDVLTVWVAMDAATLENGPVSYLRGSHRNGLLPHEASGMAGNSMKLAGDLDRTDAFVGTVASGDALIHHCQTIHYSEPNHTDNARCGLLFVFRGTHTRLDPNLKAAYDHAREAVKIKT